MTPSFFTRFSRSEVVLSGRALIVSLTTATFVWLLLCGIPPLVGLRSLVGFFSLSALGYLLCSRAFVEARDEQLRALWFAGPGFGIGLLLAFLVRLVSTKETLLAVVALATVTVIVTETRDARKRRFHDANIVTPKALVPSAREALLSAGFVALPLLGSWTWMLPAAIACLVSAFILHAYAAQGAHATRIMVTTVAIGVTLAAVALGSSLQSRAWWMLADDNQFFEGLAFRLFESGPAKSVLSVSLDGFSAVAYHHLAYFLAGFLEGVSNSPDFVALTMISPLFISMSLVSSMFLLAARTVRSWNSRSDGDARLIPGILLVLISQPIAQLPLSNFLGYLALVVTLVCVLEIDSRTPPWAMIAMPTVLLGLVAFSKVPYLYAAVFLLLAGGFASGVHRMRIFTSTVVGSVVILGFFAMSAPAASDLHFSFFEENSLSELAFGGLANRVLALVVVVTPLLPGVVASVFLFLRDGDRRFRVLALASVLVMGCGYVSRFVLGGRIESLRYLWEPAQLLATLIFALWMLREDYSFPSGRRFQVVSTAVISSLVWSLVVPRVVPNLGRGSVVAKSLRFVRSPAFLLLLVAAVLLVAHVLRSRGVMRQGTVRLRGIPVAMTVALGFYLGSYLASHGFTARERLREIASGREDQERSDWLPTQDMLEVAEFIRLTVQAEEVFALTLCNPSHTYCLPNDLRLLAVADQRVLSAGGSYFAFRNMNDSVRSDYELSLSLPRNEPADGAEALKARGVRWLVADKRYVSQAWLSSAAHSGLQQRFTNDSYAVFEIAQLPLG